jgi:integrase
MLKTELARVGAEWLREQRDLRGLSPNTIRTYRSILTVTFRALPHEFEPEDMRDCLSLRLGPHASVHVRRSNFVVLSLFFRWWEGHGGPVSPFRQMSPPPKSQARRRALTETELEMLTLRLRSARIKDKAEIMLLLFQGFRLEDVTNLHFLDVDVAGRRIRARQGKGGTDAWLPMGQTTADTLALYFEAFGIDGGWAFTGPNGKLSTRAISKAWKRVSGDALKGVVPHMLRHSYANLILRGQSQTDVNTLRRLMRHSSLATTQLYLSDDDEAARNAIVALDEHLSRIGRTA